MSLPVLTNSRIRCCRSNGSKGSPVMRAMGMGGGKAFGLALMPNNNTILGARAPRPWEPASVWGRPRVYSQREFKNSLCLWAGGGLGRYRTNFFADATRLFQPSTQLHFTRVHFVRRGRTRATLAGAPASKLKRATFCRALVRVGLLTFFFSTGFRLARRHFLIRASAREKGFGEAIRSKVPCGRITIRSNRPHFFQCHAMVVVVKQARIILLTVTRFPSSASGGRHAVFLAGNILAFFKDGIQVALRRFLYVGRVGFLQRRDFRLKRYLAGIGLHTRSDAVCAICCLLRVIYIPAILQRRPFPVPLIRVR